jgi:predicted DNA-binding antitoxin AbrB/MazE fold protein
MTKGGWRCYEMTKTIEFMYENGVFKPLQRVDLPEKVKLRMRIESEGLYELIEDLSKMFMDVKEDPLKILLENRR